MVPGMCRGALGSWNGQILSPLLFAHPFGGISAFSFSGCDIHPLALQRVHRGSPSSSSGASAAGDLSYVHLFVTLLFAVTYKTLSEVGLSWRDVLPGSAVTAILFTIGNYVIEVYVSLSDIGSAYGAAGSVVVLLFWIYYSAQIFLFGAEFIKVTKMVK